MGVLYQRYEAIRRMIIKNFPNNKIIIFPQTIDYGKTRYGDREFKRAKEIYNNHKNLFFAISNSLFSMTFFLFFTFISPTSLAVVEVLFTLQFSLLIFSKSTPDTILSLSSLKQTPTELFFFLHKSK